MNVKNFVLNDNIIWRTVFSIWALVTRLVIGLIFLQAGAGKFKNLSNTVEFFRSLNIPHPELQAPFIACIELFGGLALMLGLYTRFAAIPLIGVMTVATLTAHLSEIEKPMDTFNVPDVLYGMLLLGLVGAGAGWFSLDNFIGRGKKAKAKQK